MQVILYNFSKRENSTQEVAPNNPTAKTLNCQLKDECNFTNPVLLISPNILPGTFSPSAYNYAKIQYWSRYYFVKNWTWKNAVWEVELTVDVLASFKGEIGNTETYIERSSYAYDGTIVDNLYPCKTSYQIQHTSVANSWYNVAPSGGCYVLGVINYQSSNHIGSVAYYACSQANLNSLLNYLYSDSIYTTAGIEEIGEGLYKTMFSPIQYIVSCIWFPFTTSTFGSSTTNIKVGYWDTTVNATMVSNIAQKTFVTATLPSHPYASSRGTYLNYAPYTTHTLFLPPFGSFSLDTSYKAVGNYLYSAVAIDHITGEATIRISICADSSHVNEYNIQEERTVMLGIPIQISQVMIDTGSLTGLGFSVGGSLIHSVGEIIGNNQLSSIGNALMAGQTSVNSVGSNGSFTGQILVPELVSRFAVQVDEDRSELGRPLCQVRKINTLSGYVKCTNTDHAFSCTADEKSMINTYLKDGFFYE